MHAWVDYEGITRTLDFLEQRALADLRDLLTDAQDALVAHVSRHFDSGKTSQRWVAALRLRRFAPVRERLQVLLQESTEVGQADVRREVPRGRLTQTFAGWDEGKHPRHPKGSESGGEFAPKGGADAGIQLTPTKERAWSGEARALRSKLNKLETGEIGERAVIAYLRRDPKSRDARSLNVKVNNFPLDLIGDHEVTEVKAGLVSNGKSAQQWRATAGQPGNKERAWLAKASKEKKAAWNEKKQGEILKRKQQALAQVSRQVGRKVKGQTITTIIDPDRKVVDVYKFDGFHLRIAWNSDAARKGYVGSFKYE
jgi:hypothetical protein